MHEKTCVIPIVWSAHFCSHATKSGILATMPMYTLMTQEDTQIDDTKHNWVIIIKEKYRIGRIILTCKIELTKNKFLRNTLWYMELYWLFDKCIDYVIN